MQLISIFLTVGVARALSTAGRSHGGQSKVHLQSGTNHSKVGKEPKALPVNLAVIADQCKCRFIGLCTCSATVEFMDCIADACASGVCECNAVDFVASCNGMSETCPEAELSCSQETASCMHVPSPSTLTVTNITEELTKLKERKCTLLAASQAGYLNAERRLKELEPVIQGKLDLLKERGVKAFYMGCAPAPSGSNWTVSYVGGEAELVTPPPEPVPVVTVTTTQAAAAKRKATEPVQTPVSSPAEEQEKKRFWVMFMKITVYLLFVILFAFLYDKVRHDTVFPQVKGVDDHEAGFSYGLFGCFQDMRLSVFSCMCPALRWADTMDKTGNVDDNYDPMRLITYWKGIALIATLYALNMYIGYMAMLPFVGFFFAGVLLAVNVIYRQKLRRRYQILAGSFRTIAEDTCAWLCCPCCAMVQEARQVESTLAQFKPEN